MYQPQEGDEGLQLLTVAIRDFIMADPSVAELLTGGFIEEGTMNASRETPIAVLTDFGYGESDSGTNVRLVRLLIWVMDKGRGFYNIKKALGRISKRLNSTALALDFLTFPPEAELRVHHLKAPGATATGTFPTWKCEGQGLYIFVEVGGLPSSE